MQYLLVTGAGLALISHEHLSMRRVTAAATEDDEPELMELTHSSAP
ncbi:MAG: hypothetical protein HW416_1998 [Chloroflexi bacterium]|nr:hypothetical protein [Chloroflexota bacterium]